MTSDATAPSPMEPRLLLVVSDGPLLSADTMPLEDRPVRVVPVQSPPLLLPAVATTMATGVDAQLHGIVTWAAPNPDDLSLRPITAADRRYPAFWTDAAHQGLRTLTIDWPATEDDADLPDSITPTDMTRQVQAALAQDADALLEGVPDDVPEPHRKNAAGQLHRLQLALDHATAAMSAPDAPDAVCLALRTGTARDARGPLQPAIQQRLLQWLQSTPAHTAVLMINPEYLPEAGPEKPLLFRMTLIGGPQTDRDPHRPVDLRSLGGAARVMLGLSCPVGSGVPNWAFIDLPQESREERPFAAGSSEDSTNWDDLIDRALGSLAEQPDAAGATPLVQNLVRRFGTLSRLAMRSARWDALATCSERMIRLRGLVLDHWLLVHAFDRSGDIEGRARAVAALIEHYPDEYVTRIARAMSVIDGDAAQARQLLSEVDPDLISVDSSLGLMGRMCLRCGLEAKGVAALQRAVRRSVAVGADRHALASNLLAAGDAEAAFDALGWTGRLTGDIQLCLLRLRILLAMGREQAAGRFADELLEHHPQHPDILRLIGR